LSGGYWLFNSNKSTQHSQQAGNLLKTDSISHAERKHENKNDSLTKTLLINSEKQSQKTSTAANSEKTGERSYDRKKNKKQKRIIENTVLTPNEKNPIISPQSKNDNKIAEDDKEKETIANKQNNLASQESGLSKNETLPPVINNSGDKKSNDILQDSLQSKKDTEEIIAKNDSSAKKQVKDIQKKHWRLGVTFSGGTSLIGRDPLGIGNSYNDYVQNSNPNSSGSGSTPTPSFAPSVIKNSAAFAAGIFAEKNISAGSKISLGISYKYFSLINKVGARLDSINNAQYFFLSQNIYSATNASHSYRNHFHFLEVPVMLSFRLSRNNDLPISWNAGINISQLIGSNSLQYQYGQGFYYNDNSLLHKTQFGITTGISVTLFARQKMPFTIGPSFYYSASSISDEGLYQKKHFSFIGIRAEMLFRKK
jgi:hypothetical protein